MGKNKGNKDKINDIYRLRTGIDFEKNPDLQSEKLMGIKLNVPVRALVLLLLDIERETGIKIPEEEVLNNKFDSYIHILQIVEAAGEYKNR